MSGANVRMANAFGKNLRRETVKCRDCKFQFVCGAMPWPAMRSEGSNMLADERAAQAGCPFGICVFRPYWSFRLSE